MQGSLVLVVDDSPVDRRLAGALLQKRGYEVQFAEDGRAALASIAERQPAVVVTDLHMPHVTGLELVAELRRTHPSLPVILMTAHGSQDVAATALRTGAASYVPKRQLAQDLAETVGTVLQLSREGKRDSLLDPLEVREARFELGLEIEPIGDVVGQLEANLVQLGLLDEVGVLQVAVALREAIVNAIVHGNLEVASSLLDVDGGAPFHALAAQRRAEAPYRHRKVVVVARYSPDEVVYEITDEGPGFDPSTLPDPTDVENLDRVHGRGLMLIRTFMDEVTFGERGNHIRMVKRRPAG